MRKYLWVLLLGLTLATVGLRPSASHESAASAQELSTPAAGQVEIVETRLPTYSAEVTKIAPEGMSIKLAGQLRVIPFDQLLRVRLNESAPQVSKPKTQIELHDGSVIQCQQFTSDGKLVQLLTGDGSTLQLPARAVASCLQQPLDAVLARQWETIVESRIGGDLLVLQRSPDALDKIEGLISSITDKVVKFQFDGQDIDVQRTKLAGWRFYSASAPPRSKLLAVVRDTSGSTWMASQINAVWKGSSDLQIELTGGAKLSLPRSSVTEIDFSFGSMRFLADMEPLERRVQPRLALAVPLPEADQLFGPRPSPPESARGTVSGPGLQFMGSGSLTFRVPEDFKRLLGSVALTPEGSHFVPCQVQVLMEDKVIWEQKLTEPHQLQKLELAIEPGRRVHLIVQAEGKQPLGDLVTWRQLRFVK